MPILFNNTKFNLPQSANWLCLELPATEYKEIWDMQLGLATARKENILKTDMVIILEHLPVFTLGRRGGLKNLIVSENFLKNKGIPIVHVERGGDITFHGPGQIVVYPIISLIKAKLKVVEYVEKLEEIMIRTVAAWGIKAERNPVNRGVWVGKNKLGSLGIAVRRGISFHGFALNVNIPLEPFSWINPCGLQGVGITSLSEEINKDVPVIQVQNILKSELEFVFGVALTCTDLSELQRKIGWLS
ncbi:MAG: lipoyl(octanoyl) transferase LipB [Desulfobacteraceae bacterium]|nr:lipoyl(octanoyl) transferase LipB [Desulfobacteraceae bacterium]